VKCIPDKDERESCDDDDGRPCDDVEPGLVGVRPHKVVLVDQLQHEDQDQREKNAV